MKDTYRWEMYENSNNRIKTLLGSLSVGGMPIYLFIVITTLIMFIAMNENIITFTLK